jgi:multiple sugar transport system substrate-binding protein
MRTLGSAILPLLLLLGGCTGAEEGIVLRFLERPDDGGGWAEIIETFEATHPGIRVELIEGPTATNTREGMYTTAFLAGDDTYDLIYMDVIWVAKFAANGWLLPLDQRLPAEQHQDFLPGDLQGSFYEGHLYRIPLRSDAGVLFYRRDLITDPPETFAELTELAQAHLDPPTLYGFAFQGSQYEGLVCTFLEILWGHGGDVLDDTGRVVLDEPEAIQALEWLVETVGETAPEAVTTYQEEESRHLFHEGRVAFLRNWPYVWSKAQEENSPIKGRVGIAPMVHAPGGRSTAVLGGWGFGIAKTCRHPDAAWAFIEHATSAESMKTLNRRNGAIPARRSLYQDPELVSEHPHYPDLYRVLLTARPRPVHPDYPQISDALQVHLSAALVGRETPTEALNAASARIREILSPS